MREYAFGELGGADLVVDAVYKGSTAKHVGADPLARLLPVGNQGGFRVATSGSPKSVRLAILFTTLSDPDWPDTLDLETGRFTYYGDNKRPGHAIHDTPRGGNDLLRRTFNAIHAQPPDRSGVAPFFVFSRADGWDVKYRGLVVPGARGVTATDELVALWRTSEGERFQNYRAIFTVLDAPVVSRAWLQDLLSGKSLTSNAPVSWRRWVETGVAQALISLPTLSYRKEAAQIPQTAEGVAVIGCIRDYFEAQPHRFEGCAAELARLMDPNVLTCDVTRISRDGGRDAIGNYRIGTAGDAITVEFALEAKCYRLDRAVGVKEISRLISRLRHRQFGILVTTSFVHEQAYKEIRDDAHPVIIMSAVDIVNLLGAKGYATPSQVEDWLRARFPLS